MSIEFGSKAAPFEPIKSDVSIFWHLRSDRVSLHSDVHLQNKSLVLRTAQSWLVEICDTGAGRLRSQLLNRQGLPVHFDYLRSNARLSHTLFCLYLLVNFPSPQILQNSLLADSHSPFRRRAHDLRGCVSIIRRWNRC